MTTQWHGAAVFRLIEEAAAKGLLAAALTLETELRRRVSVPNPPPYHNSSKPGEYPRLRTGAGQKSIAHEPATLAEVMKEGIVRVGYRAGAGDHMQILEERRQRLGVEKTLQDLRARLARIAVGEFT